MWDVVDCGIAPLPHCNSATCHLHPSSVNFDTKSKIIMPEYLQAFILGNAAILTNVCILPLYPGLLAYMAANANNEKSQRAMKWMGLLVFIN